MRCYLDRNAKRTPTPFEAYSIAILTGGAAIVTIQHALGNDPNLCPLYMITSIPCPLCGGTRAATALALGNPALALQYNPLAMAVLALLVTAALSYLALSLPLRKRPVIELSRVETYFAAALVIAAFAANWAYVLTAQMYKVPLRW